MRTALRRVSRIGFALVLVLGTQQPAIAGVILQDQANSFVQIFLASPIGQTFTAEDANIAAIAFSLEDGNDFLSNDLTTMTLYEGVGLGGAVLHVASTVVTPGTSGFFDFDFSAVTLTVGDVYTAIISRPNGRWLVGLNQHAFPGGAPIGGAIDYVGGDAITGGVVDPIFDMQFRVTPSTSRPVPEPSTIALFALGLLGAGLAASRRAR